MFSSSMILDVVVLIVFMNVASLHDIIDTVVPLFLVKVYVS